MATKSENGTSTAPGMVHVGFRAPEKLVTTFEEIAKANERTTSAELRHLMKQHVEQRAA